MKINTFQIIGYNKNKHSYYKVQRYRCKAWRKTFVDTTNTILYCTRKGNEWIAFVECMFKGYSLWKSAEIVGVTCEELLNWSTQLV